MTQWYYADDARNRHGPLTPEDLRTHYRERRIRDDTLVWREGLAEWLSLHRVAAEIGLDAVTPDSRVPPPLPPHGIAAGPYASRPAPAQKKGMSGCLIAVLICAGLAIPVIGILAAIALPAYQDYTVRAKVMQAMNDAAPLKLAIEAYAAEQDACPDNDSATIAPALRQAEQGANIQAVQAGTLEGGDCAFELTLGGIGPHADGKTLLFAATRNGEHIEWDCSGGDVPARYRPAQCRSTQ